MRKLMALVGLASLFILLACSASISKETSVTNQDDGAGMAMPMRISRGTAVQMISTVVFS